MPRKTWIKVKRGILEPKHRKRLGARIWLYIYMLDNADWESGKIEGWTDAHHAKQIKMPYRTLQEQRQRLEADGYIRCDQGFQSQTITITNWTDPRLYSDEVINGTENPVPSRKKRNHGTGKSVPMVTENPVPIQSENTVPLHIVNINTHMLTTYKVELPAALDNLEFQDAWMDWEAYRKEARKKLTPLSVKKQIKLLAKYPAQAGEMIEASIRNGWQGIFEPKPAGRNNGGKLTTFERNMVALEQFMEEE